MLACETIAQYLVDAGAEMHFGVVGEGNVAIVSSLQERGVVHHYSRREDAAISMADGWYRRTGRLSFCSVTCGPGFTNSLTALIEAVKRKSRVLMLTGLTAQNDLRHPQLVETEAMVRASGAGWRRLRGPEFIARDLADVIRLIGTERRPYVVGVPTELLYTPTDELYFNDVLPETLPLPLLLAGDAAIPNEGQITEVVQLISESRRPLILAGSGAFESGARDDLDKLAQLLRAPIATTLVAKGMFSASPWAVGVSGGLGTRFAADTVAKADLVLAFGASLNSWTTMWGSLYEQAKIVQFDRDPSVFGQWQRTDLAVLGDAHASASRVVEECVSQGVGERGWGFGESGPVPPAMSDDVHEGLPRPIDVALTLRPLLPKDATLAFDAGHCVMDTVTRWEASSPARSIIAIHSASIGLGLGTAIGACLADTSEWTVFATGDGGLLMAFQELDTVRRLKIPMIIVVMDDKAAGAEIHYLRSRGLSDEIAYTDSPDFTAVAKALDFEAYTVDDVDDLATVFASVLAGPKRPVMITVAIDSEEMNDWYNSFSSSIETVRGWAGA